MDANCTPSTCVNSAIDARTRRRNSETINSCVGSAMGKVPLEAAWRATVVIGVPIIPVFEREREKIHSMGRGTSKDTSSPRCGVLLACKYATVYHDDVHDRSPSGDDRSGRGKGGLRRRFCSIYHSGMLRVTPRKVRLYSLLGRVSVSQGLLRLYCVTSLYPSGGVGAGRKAHQSSSLSCVTIPRIWACRCIASSLFLRLNTARGRLKSIA